MASGRRGGAAPKDPGTQANAAIAKKEQARVRIVDSAPVSAPAIPRRMPDGDAWPPQTLRWWKNWINDPMTLDYRQSDWADLLDCMVIHGMFWSTGQVKYASELRLRLARHGATREDRARLRITFATADEAERKALNGKRSQPTARERRAAMRNVNDE